ncbi:MAG: hypothetical protein Q7V17_22485 [Afipia sp.]|nr:hypothetical protein [Afipia sp.]
MTKAFSQLTGEPEEIPPGQPAEPPQESPPGNPRPEVPPPMHDPVEPDSPRELPPNAPDELPVRGPKGPRTPYPANDPGIIDLPGSDPDVNPGAPQLPPGTMRILQRRMSVVS